MNDDTVVETITLKKLAILAPNPTQARSGKAVTKLGKAIVPANVERIKKSLLKDLSALLSPESPITITQNWEIVSGNHRACAVAELLETGLLEGGTEIVVRRYTRQLSVLEIADKVQRANFGAYRGNSRAVVFGAATEFTTSVLHPVLRAVQKASTSETKHKAFSHTREQQLAQLLAACIQNAYRDENPSFNEVICRLTAADIYQAKGDDEAGPYAYGCETIHRISRAEAEMITLRLEAGASLIRTLRQDGTWKNLFGNNSTLEYVFLAASVRGDINERNLKKTLKNTIKYAPKIKDFSKKFVNDPLKEEANILTLVLEG
jgi:hypothetical protein